MDNEVLMMLAEAGSAYKPFRDPTNKERQRPNLINVLEKDPFAIECYTSIGTRSGLLFLLKSLLEADFNELAINSIFKIIKTKASNFTTSCYMVLEKDILTVYISRLESAQVIKINKDGQVVF